MSLENFTDAELNLELIRRIEIANKLEEEKHQKLVAKIQSLLTQELVDLLQPEHRRTSCSDSDLSNGFYSDSYPRCERCALLQVVSGSWDPDAWNIYFDISFSQRHHEHDWVDFHDNHKNESYVICRLCYKRPE